MALNGHTDDKPLGSPTSPRSSSIPHPDDDFDDMDPTSISTLFTDAELYNQFLAAHGPYNLNSPDAATQSVHSFVALVGDDLDPAEKEVAGRFAQLSAKNWEPQEHEGTQFVDTPEALSEDESSSSSSSEEPHRDSLLAQDTVDSTPSTSTENTLPEEEPPVVLSPEETVDVLIQEFGSLGPAGEEKLVCEADGAIIQDVVILGIVHLTTHRLTFHASLPSSDPSLSTTSQIIKAGNAMIHRRGLHRKRRVWLELSHDFVSAFPSAREEDRIRPWRSVKLSSIQEVCPENPHHPRHIRFSLDATAGIKDGSIEFDTIESARDWRREVQAALFFARRRIRHFLENPQSDDVEGVRICIPLDRIAKMSKRMQANAIPIISFTINTEDGSESSVPTNDAEPGAAASQVIDLAAYKADERWKEMEQLIAESKIRSAKEKADFPDRAVFVDVGLSDQEEASSGANVPKTREQTLCDVLAIDYTPDVWVTRACLPTGLMNVGFLVVSPQWVGFWSKSLTLRDVHYRLAVSSIRSAFTTGSGIRALSVYCMQLEIEGHANLRFLFRSESVRNEAIKRVTGVVAAYHAPRPISPISPTVSRSNSSDITMVSSSPSPISPQSASRARSMNSLLVPMGKTYPSLRAKLDAHKVLQFPKAVNPPPGAAAFTSKPQHYVCLTIGSRGDVQPYIALGLGLKRDGNSVTIVTHPEYKAWIEGFGLRHRSAGGDPGALMQLSVENKMFSPQFFKTSLGNYRSWLDQLLLDAWDGCCDADVLLESPYAMAGVHIAEALHIPYFRVCTMPWTKTTEFPHPFIGPPVETPTANSISYVLFDNIFWAATSGQINRWRRDHLNLDYTVMNHTAQSKIPILYNFSPAVVPTPLDWSDSKIICGYWFLDNPDLDWTPPETLLAFMRQAREDKKPLVYIGFGSITVPNPQTMTEHIFQAVQKSGVRAIVSRGWSSRMSKKVVREVEVPKECYMVDKIPHDWLFAQIDAALHHGGAGTTGASLRAGIPTLIKPWFGDQYFWASRVAKLGAGLRVPSIRVNDLVHALTRATTDRIMREKAVIVGQRIRAEDGVAVALHSIYTYLPRASSAGITPD